MIKLTGDCQFRYILSDVTFRCPCCKEKSVVYADIKGNLKDTVKCEFCKTISVLPHHYIDTYHNKQCRAVTVEDK